MLGLFGRKKTKDRTEASWMVCLGDHEGKPILYRIRSKSPENVENNDWVLIRTTWRFDPDERGLPGSKDNEQIEVFEDLLEQSLGESEHTIMALVTTGNGTKEWYIYSSSGLEITALIDRLASKHAFPIKTRQSADPEWTAYREIREAVAET